LPSKIGKASAFRMKSKLNMVPGMLAGLLLLVGVGLYTGYALVRLGYALASEPAHNLVGPLAALIHEKPTVAQAAALAGGSGLLLLVGSGLLLLTGLKSRMRLAEPPPSSVPVANTSVEAPGELSWLASTRNHLLLPLHHHQLATLTHLTRERNYLRSLVDALDEGVLLVDSNWRVLVANPVISKLLNLPVKQLVGRTIAALAQENTLCQQLLPLLTAPAAERPAEAPVLTLPTGVEKAYYRVQISEVANVNGHAGDPVLAGTVLALRDVSDYRKRDQTKWRFLTTVSQELQTPLANMHLSLQRLQDGKAGPLTPEQQNIAYTLARENKHLRKVVHELLDVSQLELGTIQLNFQAARLHELVRFVTDTIRPQLQPKRLLLEVQVPDSLPLVRADIEKTTWVLLSLLANAIRYSHLQDKLHLSASLLPSGQHVQVRVQDQGPGIELAMQEKIFQRFAQLPTQGGSGLGLSIAREFMSSQGGKLWVESAPGAGSTFLFTLPVSGQ
jgi:NtrC-family two-component system sensor histidine kinase KinB